MGDELIGRSIRVETEEGTFDGVIHGVDSKNKKLILNKVSMSDGRKLRGLQIFFNSEIKNLCLVDAKKPEEEHSSKGSADGDEANEEVAGKENMTDQEEEDTVVVEAKDPSDEGSRLIPRKPIAPNKFLAGEDVFVRNQSEEIRDPPDVILIDEIDDQFKNAISYINEQRVVGLAAEGENIGRSGQLCFLIIGCRKTTYIFDVYKMGSACLFESDGLKSVLENCYLLKVIHDCRCLSDCLHHQYKTKMVNIFDTQVADIIIYKKKRGKLPRDVNGLVACLYEYLNLKPSQCVFNSILNGFYKSPFRFTSRPSPADLIDAMAQKVLYLRELKIIQTENMVAEFLHGVDIYLEEFRGAPNKNNNFMRSKRVPAAFNRLKNAEEKRWKRYSEMDQKIDDDGEYPKGDEHNADDLGNTTNENNVSWTEGTHFATAYQKKHGRLLERSDKPTTGGSRYDMGNQYPAPTNSNKPWGLEKSSEAAKANGNESVVFRSESKVVPRKSKDKNTVSLQNQRAAKSNYESGFREEHSKSKPQPNNNISNNLMNEAPSFVKAKKPQIDWFDCDTPSSGRSRSSSIETEPSVRLTEKLKPGNARTRTISNASSYDDEFPALSLERQKISPKQSRDSGQKENTPNMANTCREIFGARGVKQGSPNFESVGRARIRELNASRATNLTPGGMVRKFGTKDSYAFPSDNDLMNTNPIIETDFVSHIPGKMVKFQKITAKE